MTHLTYFTQEQSKVKPYYFLTMMLILLTDSDMVCMVDAGNRMAGTVFTCYLASCFFFILSSSMLVSSNALTVFHHHRGAVTDPH